MPTALPHHCLDPALAPFVARSIQRHLSPWHVVLQQCGVGILVAVAAWLLTFDALIVMSAVYGVLVVLVPALLFVHGLSGRLAAINAMTAVTAFFIWQAVKVCASIAMLIAAPQMVQGLSWPAMLAGLVLTTQVYWLAMRPSHSKIKN